VALRRISLLACIITLVSAAHASAHTARDEKGDTYKLDIRSVIARHHLDGPRPYWTFRVNTYDAFDNSQLQRGGDNEGYMVALCFDTDGDRACDRGAEVYTAMRGDRYVPKAQMMGGKGFHRFDGGGRLLGHPRIWRPGSHSVELKVPVRYLRHRRSFSWRARTESPKQTVTTNEIYFDYAPSPGHKVTEG
jgi:hypothetical protein